MTKLTKSYNLLSTLQHIILPKVFLSTLTFVATSTVFMGLVALPAHADNIYKVVDEKTGQVTFTDRPQSYQSQSDTQVSPVALSTPTHTGTNSYYPPYTQQPPVPNNIPNNNYASSATISTLSTKEHEEPPQPEASEKTETTSPHYRLTLVEPNASRAYRRPVQPIEVQAQVSPRLQASDKVVVYLDGKEVAQGLSSSIETTEILPGEHQLSVSVLNDKGNKISEVNQTVYVIQNTQAFQKKKRLAEQLQAYQQLPWYKKLYIRMRQDTNPPTPAQ